MIHDRITDWAMERRMAKNEYMREFERYLRGRRKDKPSKNRLWECELDSDQIENLEMAALMMAAHIGEA